MENSLLITGSGGSLGTPVVGCSCDVCHSTNVKNHRFRSSALLKYKGKQILIDPGPDCRMQCLRAEITHLDGIILTHVHNDHSAGMDDLRVFSYHQHQPLPFLVLQETHEDLKPRFSYVFDKFAFQILREDEGETIFEGIPIQYFTYQQASAKVLGFRSDGFAYVTDIKHYNESTIKRLKGVKVLILSALREAPVSPVHLSIDDAITFAQKVDAERTYFIHLAHEVDHDEVNAKLPAGIQLAYDGLEIPIVNFSS